MSTITTALPLFTRITRITLDFLKQNYIIEIIYKYFAICCGLVNSSMRINNVNETLHVIISMHIYNNNTNNNASKLMLRLIVLLDTDRHILGGKNTANFE